MAEAQSKLTPNYITRESEFSILPLKKSIIPIAWPALCQARFGDQHAIREIQVYSINKFKKNTKAASWKKASWQQNNQSGQEALLLVLEVNEFIPGFEMREILLGLQRLFAQHPEMLVYFMVIASPESSTCIQRLYPAHKTITNSKKRAMLMYKSSEERYPFAKAA